MSTLDEREWLASLLGHLDLVSYEKNLIPLKKVDVQSKRAGWMLEQVTYQMISEVKANVDELCRRVSSWDTVACTRPVF